jgi:hypothetical protein
MISAMLRSNQTSENELSFNSVDMQLLKKNSHLILSTEWLLVVRLCCGTPLMGYVEFDCLNRSLKKKGIWNGTQSS